MKAGIELRAIAAAALLRCAPGPCPVSEAPCTTTLALFVSSCGFQSFTTTCTATASCGGDSCFIPIKTPQTCDATIVLGDGAQHGAHLVITAPPAEDAGRCPATCAKPGLALTVDGADAGPGVVQFASATCVASDGGLDATADAASD